MEQRSTNKQQQQSNIERNSSQSSLHNKKFQEEEVYPPDQDSQTYGSSSAQPPKRIFKDENDIDPLRAAIGSKQSEQVSGAQQMISGNNMIGVTGSVPSHRSQKRPVSILKNKRNQVGRFVRNTNQFWDYYGSNGANGESSNSDNNQQQPKNAGQKTITQTNFFECREVTNCEFIYEQSEKNPNRGGLFDSLSRMITRQGTQVEISSLCAIKDLLVIGFSNGVLILFDIDKLEIIYQNKNFTKNDKSIDKLKLFQMESTSVEDSINLLISLSDGMISYHMFPKITLVDELIIERDILDFQPYQINRRPFLSTVHRSKEIKIFRLRKRMDYQFVTKFNVDQIPLSFVVHRDIFVITYKTHAEYVKLESKGKEQESITRVNLWQNNEPSQRFNPFPVFDESIQAFIITKEDYSFYMDLKGVYDREFNKIKWSDHVMNVEVVRPYLVGFLPNSIEIKNIFNPNRVVQKIELLSSTICKHTVALNHINLRELDSTYILLNRKQSNIKVLLKMTQIDPRVQINMLIERKLYSTGLKFCDFLLENNFEGLTRDQYDKLQKEKGFYNFIVKRRYAISKDIFKEYKVPIQHVMLLFREVYPQTFIKNLIQMFDINVKEIPYLEVSQQKELYYISTQGGRYGGTSSVGVVGGNDINYLKNEIDSDKMTAMKEFLTYFLKKRVEIIKKIEQMTLNEKQAEFHFHNQPIQHHQMDEGGRFTVNPGSMLNEQFFQQMQHVAQNANNNNGGNQQTPKRRGSFGGTQQDQYDNMFDLQVIPERLHQSDNENVNVKISQLLYLRIMTEIFLFHSLIILVQSDEEKDKITLKNEFYTLIKNDNILPNDFCKEVFFCYHMYDECLQFLFYKKEYHELLSLIQKEYEKNKQDKEQQKYWIQKFVKYCKKINEFGNEDFIIGHTDWIFKVDTQMGLECVKKFSKQDPFKSEKVLRHIKAAGGARACFRYLEYLTLECEITDGAIHTELACVIVEQINYVLINYMIKPNGSDENAQLQLDVQKADEDAYIFGLRKKLLNFLQTSDYFIPQVILEIMPPNYLLKERALILANQRKYKEAFSIAIDQICDAEFAMVIAHKALKWHKDKSVYFYLFVKLLQVGEREQAMQVLKNNFHFIPFDKVSLYLKDEEIFDINLSQFYQRSFIEMEKVSKELKILRGLTTSEYYKAAEEMIKLKSEYFLINDDTICARCQKKINSYPFYYLPKSKDIVHYYCFNNDNVQRDTQVSPNKKNEQEQQPMEQK